MSRSSRSSRREEKKGTAVLAENRDSESDLNRFLRAGETARRGGRFKTRGEEMLTLPGDTGSHPHQRDGMQVERTGLHHLFSAAHPARGDRQPRWRPHCPRRQPAGRGLSPPPPAA